MGASQHDTAPTKGCCCLRTHTPHAEPAVPEQATSRPQLLRPEPSCCYGDACKPAVSGNQALVTCGAHAPTVLRGSLLAAANTLDDPGTKPGSGAAAAGLLLPPHAQLLLTVRLQPVPPAWWGLEAVNLDELLLHQLLLCQELQDVFALIALQLDDLRACMRPTGRSEGRFQAQPAAGQQQAARIVPQKGKQRRIRSIPPWQGRKTHLA